ncbi:MAG TPA: hypothetical protein VLV18_06895 [Terriglobales bacterium]|nr:hypothetical protein [Terriglobales bacterium]
MICPECKVGTVIQAPTISNYEIGDESVCDFCGLILEQLPSFWRS